MMELFSSASLTPEIKLHNSSSQSDTPETLEDDDLHHREHNASRHLPVFGSKNKGRKKESCLVLDKKTLMTKSNVWYQTSNLY
jgi:hypothetical protein